jgi:phage shock protein C
MAAGKIKRLYRSKTDKVFAGICGGIGNYLGVDPVIIRLIWVLLTLCAGAGILVYLLAWLIVPQEK